MGHFHRQLYITYSSCPQRIESIRNIVGSNVFQKTKIMITQIAFYLTIPKEKCLVMFKLRLHCQNMFTIFDGHTVAKLFAYTSGPWYAPETGNNKYL